MSWREQLKKLEKEEAFDIAIFFMQTIIKKDPHDMDVYLAFLYLLADTMVGPHSWDCAVHDEAVRLYYHDKHTQYAALGEKYFARSYFKFNNNPEYLLVASYVLVMEPWSFGVDDVLRDTMWQKMYDLDPDNPLYQSPYYAQIYKNDPQNSELTAWATLMVGVNSPLNQLNNKGSAWEYVQEMAKCFPKQILEEQPL